MVRNCAPENLASHLQIPGSALLAAPE